MGREHGQDDALEQEGRRTVEIPIAGPITLGQLLKLAGVASTGGQAKALLMGGGVTVNGRPEGRRGRKLGPGDLVGLPDRVLLVGRACEPQARTDASTGGG